MKKKLWLIAALLMCAVMALTVFAEGEDDYTYIVLNGKATITDVETTISGDVVIPETLGGYPVEAIGNKAFDGCADITSVAVHDGITKIGVKAFQNCTNMTAVSLPDSISYMGTYTFSGCTSLTKARIPENTAKLPSRTFKNCSKLSDVYLPDSITSIETSAFYGCDALKYIDLPDNLTSIGSSAFYDCGGIKSITLPNGVTSIGDMAFNRCYSLTGIAIPASVTSIGSCAFHTDSDYNYPSYRLPNLTIYGYTGSYAETYAKKQDIPFFSLGDVAEPVITADPEDIACFTGDDAALTVLAEAASAGTFTYRWYVSDTPDGEFTEIEGAADASYTPSTDTAGVKYYYVIVTNTNGTHSADAQSRTAKVTVASGTAAEVPEIFAQTASFSCETGEDIALFVSASVTDGGSLTYQWYVSDTPDGEFEPIEGAVSAGYRPSSETEGTLYYTVVITNTNTGVSGTKSASVTGEVIAVTVGGTQLCTITGSLVSWGDTADVTIRLLADGEVIRTVTVENTSGTASFSIPDVEPGEYTVEVSKPDHVTREYEVTVQ